ncbi:coiled-coil domain-containing protein [Methylobacterium sp. JK268]
MAAARAAARAAPARMTAVAFDTLKFARTLRDRAKMPAEQAEGLADALLEAMQGDLATKSDMEGLRADLGSFRAETKAEFDSVRAATKAEFDVVRAATKAEFDAVRAATKAEIDALRAETKTDTLQLKAEVEALRKEMITGHDALRKEMITSHDALRKDMLTGHGTLRTEMRADRQSLEARFDAKIESAKTDLIRWVFGIVGFQTLTTIGALVTFMRLFKP